MEMSNNFEDYTKFMGQLRFTNHWGTFASNSPTKTISLEAFADGSELNQGKDVLIVRKDNSCDRIPKFITDNSSYPIEPDKLNYSLISKAVILAWRWANGSAKQIIINESTGFFFEATNAWLSAYPCISSTPGGYSVNEDVISRTLFISGPALIIGGTINPSHFFGEYLAKLAAVDIDEPTIILWEDKEWIRESIKAVKPKAKIMLIDLGDNSQVVTRLIVDNCIVVEDTLNSLQRSIGLVRQSISFSRCLFDKGMGEQYDNPGNRNTILHLSRLRYELLENSKRISADLANINRFKNYGEVYSYLRAINCKTIFPERHSIADVFKQISEAKILICEYGSLFSHLIINQRLHENLAIGRSRLIFLMPKRFIDVDDKYTLGEHRWLKSLWCKNMVIIEGTSSSNLDTSNAPNYNNPCYYSQSQFERALSICNG